MGTPFLAFGTTPRSSPDVDRAAAFGPQNAGQLGFWRILPATGLSSASPTSTTDGWPPVCPQTVRTRLRAVPRHQRAPHVSSLHICDHVALITLKPAIRHRSWEADWTWVFIQIYRPDDRRFVAPVIRKDYTAAALW